MATNPNFEYPPTQGATYEHIKVKFDSTKPKQGGYGTVYFGEHQGLMIEVVNNAGQPRAVARPVAVKFWCPKDGNKDTPPQFFDLEIARMLSHENLMPILDASRAKNGIPACFVMPRMHTIADLLILFRTAKYRLPSKSITQVIKDLCQGLGMLHKFRIVHNDITPSNLFIEFTDQLGSALQPLQVDQVHGSLMMGNFRVVVGDIGVGQRIGDPAYKFGKMGTDEKLIVDNYKAPEQRGDRPDRPDGYKADPRFDVFAVGRVLEDLLRITTDDEK